MNIKKNAVTNFRKLTTNHYPNIFRPSSKPLLSGDTIRKESQHVFDETQTLNTANVKTNDLVFVKTDLLGQFFNHYHKKISAEYILISHNSDNSVKKEQSMLMDSKVIHWFAMNLDMEMTEKISPIPIGFENRRYLSNGRLRNLINIKKDSFGTTKKDKIMASFNTHTNFSIRGPLLKQLEEDKKVNIYQSTNNYDYLKNLASHNFNICPKGNNYDTHRVWESLYLETTPVVVSNNINTNFYNMGVPLLILDSWRELENFSYEDLVELNQRNAKKDYRKYTLWNHWTEIIDSKKIR